MLLTHDHMRFESADRLIAYIEHKLDFLTRPDEITEKNTNKGYNRTLKYQRVRITALSYGLCTATWVF